MGRPVGSKEVSVETIKEIARLSAKDLDRPTIADRTGVSKGTVYIYQRGLGFI